MNTEPLTTVVFRKWPNGQIIALFPEMPYDLDGLYCAEYEHFGQHGAAGYSFVVSQTTAAKPEEYADLKRELESAPYNYRFKIRKRSSANLPSIARKLWKKD